MAKNQFLKIEGIPGESLNEAYKDQIEVLSYSHSISQPITGSISSGGAQTAERANHGKLTILKTVDRASPKLALACCRGDHIGQVVLTLCRDTGEQQKYLEITLSGAVVAGVDMGGQGDTLPCEHISFSYSKIEWNYTNTDQATGRATGNVLASWDLKTNKGS